jgi:hypothetical protein
MSRLMPSAMAVAIERERLRQTIIALGETWFTGRYDRRRPKISAASLRHRRAIRRKLLSVALRRLPMPSGDE